MNWDEAINDAKNELQGTDNWEAVIGLAMDLLRDNRLRQQDNKIKVFNDLNGICNYGFLHKKIVLYSLQMVIVYKSVFKTNINRLDLEEKINNFILSYYKDHKDILFVGYAKDYILFLDEQGYLEEPVKGYIGLT